MRRPRAAKTDEELNRRRTRSARSTSCRRSHRPYFSMRALSLERHTRSNTLCTPSDKVGSEYSPSMILRDGRRSESQRRAQRVGRPRPRAPRSTPSSDRRPRSARNERTHLVQMSSTLPVSPRSLSTPASSVCIPASCSAPSTSARTQSFGPARRTRMSSGRRCSAKRRTRVVSTTCEREGEREKVKGEVRGG